MSSLTSARLRQAAALLRSCSFASSPGPQRIELQCLKTNVPMQALAARFTSDLRQIGDTTLAVLDNSTVWAG